MPPLGAVVPVGRPAAFVHLPISDQSALAARRHRTHLRHHLARTQRPVPYPHFADQARKSIAATAYFAADIRPPGISHVVGLHHPAVLQYSIDIDIRIAPVARSHHVIPVIYRRLYARSYQLTASSRLAYHHSQLPILFGYSPILTRSKSSNYTMPPAGQCGRPHPGLQRPVAPRTPRSQIGRAHV